MTPSDPHELIEQLWRSHRSVVDERLSVIDQGLAAWERGAAADDVRVVDAHRAAHNLAGALGSYGRAEGSVLARSLMAMLERQDVAVTEARQVTSDLREACA